VAGPGHHALHRHSNHQPDNMGATGNHPLIYEVIR
jgi:hypothetical protein